MPKALKAAGIVFTSRPPTPRPEHGGERFLTFISFFIFLTNYFFMVTLVNLARAFSAE